MAAIIKSVPPVDEPSLKISEYPIPAVMPASIAANKRLP